MWSSNGGRVWNINVALMDGVKSDFLRPSVGCEQAGLGSQSRMVGRSKALLVSAVGEQLINASNYGNIKSHVFLSTIEGHITHVGHFVYSLANRWRGSSLNMKSTLGNCPLN